MFSKDSLDSGYLQGVFPEVERFGWNLNPQRDNAESELNGTYNGQNCIVMKVNWILEMRELIVARFPAKTIWIFFTLVIQGRILQR